MTNATHFRLRLTRTVALAPLLFLAACEGGKSGSPISTPSPAPSPTPTPAPTPAPAPSPSPAPAPIDYNTAEFRRSDGPSQHNATVAWSEGWAGKGVDIAVIDTGIDVDSPEFAGRLSPHSRDLFSGQTSRGPHASDDHGTRMPR